MNRTTPAKHKTPNYKLVNHTRRFWHVFMNCWRVETRATWEAMPLRADRKDLKPQ